MGEILRLPLSIPDATIQRMANERTADEANEINREGDARNFGDDDRMDLMLLLRLLLREPPSDHDFKTCTICKRHGIEHI